MIYPAFQFDLSISSLSDIMLSFATLLIGITTLILSVKISFRKTIKERQFELVYQLINDISKAQVFVSYQMANGSGGSEIFYLHHFYSPNFNKTFKHLLERKHFLIKNDAQLKFEFLKLIGHPLMPYEILFELQKFWTIPIKTLNESELVELKDYLIIDSLTAEKNPLYICAKIKEWQDFQSMYIFINKLFDTINKWLDKYDAKDLKFRKVQIN